MKPEYRVPTMAEVREIPWNGFNAISTFSGCGGSSLGYRMAGFRVLYANEFIDAARDTYNANKAPYTVLDGRDIRLVKASDILDAINMKPGELDLFDGSPPCASFSTSGSRHGGWGKVKKYSDKAQRTDDLFYEFSRLVGGVAPKTFVAENVSGLVKGTAKGYFLDILKELKNTGPGYRVIAKLLDGQWLGIPQARQRLIFVGVRADLGIEPVHPLPLPYRYSVREVLPWIQRIKCGGTKDNWQAADKPSPTVLASDATTSPTAYLSSGGYVEAETDISRFAIGREYDKLAPGEKSTKYLNLWRPDADRPCPTITATGGQPGAAGVVHPLEKRKFSIAELRRICAFPDDFVLTGSFQQQWERLGRAVPPLMMKSIASAVRDGVLVPLARKKDAA